MRPEEREALAERNGVARLKPRAPLCLVAVFVIVAAATASAHPTALTSVTVVAGDGYADVTIATDADALRLKLDALQQSLPGCIDLRADGVRVPHVARDVALGFTHILPNGLDHILFVLGLFFLTTNVRSVLAQVTAFTVAHSITLGLALYGIASLPASIVEPLIALSIAYVAIENLVTTDLKPRRLALVFSFGLLHGMGFAGVLRELGLPPSQFLTALLTFNVGVEAGQLSVIAVAFAVVASWRSDRR